MRYFLPTLIIVVLVSLLLTGGSMMVWLARATTDTLTPAQVRLLDASEWMLRGSFTALLGFLVGLSMNTRNGT